jgi:hypothetical protein
MTIEVVSDVGGHEMTLIVHGQRVKLTLSEADQAVKALNHSIDQLYFDQVRQHQQDALYKRMNHHER